jgi:hypothetical protein
LRTIEGLLAAKSSMLDLTPVIIEKAGAGAIPQDD